MALDENRIILIGGGGSVNLGEKGQEKVALYNTTGFVQDLPNLTFRERVAPGCGLKINSANNNTVCYIYI